MSTYSASLTKLSASKVQTRVTIEHADDSDTVLSVTTVKASKKATVQTIPINPTSTVVESIVKAIRSYETQGYAVEKMSDPVAADRFTLTLEPNGQPDTKLYLALLSILSKRDLGENVASIRSFQFDVLDVTLNVSTIGSEISTSLDFWGSVLSNELAAIISCFRGFKHVGVNGSGQPVDVMASLRQPSALANLDPVLEDAIDDLGLSFRPVNFSKLASALSGSQLIVGF